MGLSLAIIGAANETNSKTINIQKLQKPRLFARNWESRLFVIGESFIALTICKFLRLQKGLLLLFITLIRFLYGFCF